MNQIAVHNQSLQQILFAIENWDEISYLQLEKVHAPMNMRYRYHNHQPVATFLATSFQRGICSLHPHQASLTCSALEGRHLV